MYHLTQQATVKFFEISILSTFDHNNFKCGFSQNFSVLDKSTSEIMMIKKAIKIIIV